MTVQHPFGGAQAFHVLLLVTGIRGPYQELYEPGGSSTSYMKLWCLCRCCRLYTLAVISALCVLPVKFFWDLYSDFDNESFVHFVSECILPIQYVLAVRYFGSKHVQWFYDVARTRPRVRASGGSSASERHSRSLENNRELSNISDIVVDITNESPRSSPVNTVNNQTRPSRQSLDFHSLLKEPCRVTIGVVTLIIAITLGTSFFGAMVTSQYGWGDRELPFFVLSRFYGRGACIINTCTFSFVFYKHVKVLCMYGQILESRNWSSQQYDKVSVMLINIARIRESLKIATDELKSIYSSGTIAGTLAAAALAHSAATSMDSLHTSYDSFIVMGSFFVLQGIIFGVIARLSVAKERIENVTKSSTFAVKFLSRSNGSDSHRVALETASTLDYWLMNNILSEVWLDFSVMGVPLHSMAFLKQCASLVSLVMVLANTGHINLKMLWE